jgi:hypothetical protein
VASDEYLRRIDAHMERGNELMEQNRRAFEGCQQAFLDLRTFLRETTLRQERIFDSMGRHLEGLTRHVEGLTRYIEDLTQEQRAQRSALFRMLDRLDEGGSAAGA